MEKTGLEPVFSMHSRSTVCPDMSNRFAATSLRFVAIWELLPKIAQKSRSTTCCDWPCGGGIPRSPWCALCQGGGYRRRVRCSVHCCRKILVASGAYMLCRRLKLRAQSSPTGLAGFSFAVTGAWNFCRVLLCLLSTHSPC